MKMKSCKHFQTEAFGYYFCQVRGRILPEMCERCPELKLKSKYHNVKTEIDDIKFDSKKECNRWLELRILERDGKIKNLKRQVPYMLLPKQKSEDGKLLFRDCKYVGDFEYIDCSTGEKVIEDVKGVITPEFRLKQKMMYFFYHVNVRTV